MKSPLGYQLSSNGKPVAALNLGKENSYWFVEQNEALDVDLAATAAVLYFMTR